MPAIDRSLCDCRYVAKLKPVILGPKVLKGNWPAAHEWSKSRLRSVFGDLPVGAWSINDDLLLRNDDF